MLCDIPNTHIFGNMVSSVNTKLSDLMSKNTLNSGITMVTSGSLTADVDPIAAATVVANKSVLQIYNLGVLDKLLLQIYNLGVIHYFWNPAA